MWPEPRPELQGLLPAVHGGDAPPGVLDFSTGVSPLPPPAAVLAAARDADVTRYPHATAEPLRNAIAAAAGVAPDQVVAGAGSVELIWALARAFVGPGRRGVVFAPAFGEYAQAIRASGGEVVEVRAPGPPFVFDVELALEEIGFAPSLAFLCRPSNPCLCSVPLAMIEALSRAAPATLFVIDEAFLPFYRDVVPVTVRPNVVVLRSLTKIFALPGLRLGYLVADARIARAVQAVLPPWNVSAPASAAGIAAVKELAAVAGIASQINGLRVGLAAKMGAIDVPVDAAGGPFLLCRVGDAARFSRRLLAHGCRVRDGSSFGLPAHVRVGVREEPEQAVLVAAWERSRRA